MTLKIIGAGLGRTGTASLKIALEKLGVGRCYHMAEVLANPSLIDLWIHAADGRPDWNTLLGEYGATVDYPACTFYRELAAYYPTAKVLLTVRNPQKWFDSVHATIMSPQLVSHLQGTPFGELCERTIWSTLNGRTHDRDHMVQCFERHIENVKRNIPAERLLVYEVSQGWEPLCNFLGVPTPNESFPHVNSREETASLLAAMIAGAENESLEDRLTSAASGFKAMA